MTTEKRPFRVGDRVRWESQFDADEFVVTGLRRTESGVATIMGSKHKDGVFASFCTLLEPAPEPDTVLRYADGQEVRVGDTVHERDGVPMVVEEVDPSDSTVLVLDPRTGAIWIKVVLLELISRAEPEPKRDTERCAPSAVDAEPKPPAEPPPCDHCGLTESCRCAERRAQQEREDRQRQSEKEYAAFCGAVRGYVAKEAPRVEVVTDRVTVRRENCSFDFAAWLSIDGHVEEVTASVLRVTHSDEYTHRITGEALSRLAAKLGRRRVGR